MKRRKSQSEPATFAIGFGHSRSLRNVAVHIDFTRGEMKAREYVVTLRAFERDVEKSLPPGGWSRSRQLGAKFCYVPGVSRPGLVKLPPVLVEHSVTELRVEVHQWLGTRVPASQAVASVWLVVPDPTGGTAIYRAAEKK